MSDRWGKDQVTGARGLEFGTRVVKNGMVKIGGEWWKPTRYGLLDPYEGKKVEVSVRDAWATEYIARNADSLDNIATLVPAKGVKQ